MLAPTKVPTWRPVAPGLAPSFYYPTSWDTHSHDSGGRKARPETVRGTWTRPRGWGRTRTAALVMPKGLAVPRAGHRRCRGPERGQAEPCGCLGLGHKAPHSSSAYGTFRAFCVGQAHSCLLASSVALSLDGRRRIHCVPGTGAACHGRARASLGQCLSRTQALSAGLGICVSSAVAHSRRHPSREASGRAGWVCGQVTSLESSPNRKNSVLRSPSDSPTRTFLKTADIVRDRTAACSAEVEGWDFKRGVYVVALPSQSGARPPAAAPTLREAFPEQT